MGLLGNIRQKLLSRYKTGVVFTHVQKCGGSSVEAALFRRYRLSRERIYPIESRAAERLADPASTDISAHPELLSFDFRRKLLAYALEKGTLCVTGHNPINEAIREKHRHSHKFITVLRDPVERFCSHYRYVYRSGLGTSVDQEIDEFVTTERARWYGSNYATFFGGSPAHQPTVSTAEVEAAKKLLLSFDVVGFLDRMESFEQQLSDQLSLNINIGYENRTSERSTHWRGDFSNETLKRIRDLCQPNIEIYNYVREKRAA
ncbi:sulfotransferase family 2 domain-containing protein [Hyphococcus flavus]|uniref:Sulfotransferase family 2 domain-containing protein n=1 Tax=Hyphococcus flavus TaxID=1866326 RepID=A0AAF0CFW9_9PROT|nr:sulfotransferase family 2 domain-containing protein [Hyphococcus flavus]WDI32861.1 sulfotransferase family 2 domain-containing protein [Hyphococcus flavus]